ncbi:hypothetical protein EU534_01325, partial [Candidatus Heimdallarchaeota archaeon]
LVVKGGATHGKWAPSVEYIQFVTNEIVRRMKKEITLSTTKYGFFPRGGAEVKMNFKHHENLEPLNLIEKGELEKIDIYATASQSLAERKVAERQISSFKKRIETHVDIVEHVKYIDSFSAGTGLTAVDTLSSGSRMGCFIPGERGLSSEKIGEMCAQMWLKNSKSSGSVDSYAADQLIVPMVLTEGKSVITTTEISNHTKTNIDLVQKFIDRHITYQKNGNHFKILVN